MCRRDLTPEMQQAKSRDYAVGAIGSGVPHNAGYRVLPAGFLCAITSGLHDPQLARSEVSIPSGLSTRVNGLGGCCSSRKLFHP